MPTVVGGSQRTSRRGSRARARPPAVEVLAGERVDRLVDPAVVLGVATWSPSSPRVRTATGPLTGRLSIAVEPMPAHWRAGDSDVHGRQVRHRTIPQSRVTLPVVFRGVGGNVETSDPDDLGGPGCAVVSSTCCPGCAASDPSHGGRPVGGGAGRGARPRAGVPACGRRGGQSWLPPFRCRAQTCTGRAWCLDRRRPALSRRGCHRVGLTWPRSYAGQPDRPVVAALAGVHHRDVPAPAPAALGHVRRRTSRRRSGRSSHPVVVVGAGAVGRRLATTFVHRPSTDWSRSASSTPPRPHGSRSAGPPRGSTTSRRDGRPGRRRRRLRVPRPVRRPHHRRRAPVRAGRPPGVRRPALLRDDGDRPPPPHRGHRRRRGDAVAALGPAPHTLFLKRILDIAMSAVALVLLSPVLVACAIAVRLETGPGVIFRQVRGPGGRTFTLYKFRSSSRSTRSRARPSGRSTTTPGSDPSDGSCGGPAWTSCPSWSTSSAAT